MIVVSPALSRRIVMAALGLAVAAGAASPSPPGQARPTATDAAAAAPSAAVSGTASKELTTDLIFGGALDGLPPTGFQWAATGDRFAYLRRPERGAAPQLHVYDVAARRAYALTTSQEGPHKLDVASAHWTPSGDALLATAGGDLYLVPAPRELSARSGPSPPPRRLTTTPEEETAPRVSPDGRRVAFVRAHDLFALDLATGTETRLTIGGSEDLLNGEPDWVYEEEFDLHTAWWWSPTGDRIAYLQFDERGVPTYPIVDWIPTHPDIRMQHYPKAGDPNPILRLGVVAAAGGDTRWIDLGRETDLYIPRVGWTSDGRLAVQRLDRAQKRLELLLCDARGTGCRGVLEESDTKWINIADDWRLLKDRFVWGSERDGYRHLYLYSYDGRLIRQVTRGAWMVTGLASATEGEWILFTATEKSPLERHLYRVRADGSGMKRLTEKEGWHVVTTSGAGGESELFIDVHSTEVNPPSVTLRGDDGTLLDTLDEGMTAQLAGYRRGRVEFLTVTARDGTELPVAMTLPPDFDPARKYPVLIYVYGGPHAQVVVRQWVGVRALWHQMMAARGLIVWSLDNRGMWGRGHAWETPIYHDMGRQELADQMAGVAWLTARPYVDSSRIGIWGWSYGGYMTLYAVVNAPDAFRAAVAGAPVTDWKDYDTIYTERYMGRPSENEKGYQDSAPLRKAAALETPLLLVHGSSDDNVHMQNSVQLLDELVKAGRSVDFMLYPRKSHGITGEEARIHLYGRIERFLEQHLGLEDGRP